MNRLRVQFIAANAVPGAPLEIEKELQEIDRVLNPGGTPSRRHDLYPAPAARFDDVSNALQSNNPNCVHFSAHGSPLSRILLFDNQGQAEDVSNRAILLLFAALKDDIRVVTLSYCYSQEQARQIAEIIDCVVGINKTIRVDAAEGYSCAFYSALAAGKNVKQAHDLGCAKAASCGLTNDEFPVLFSRTGIDPATVFPGKRPVHGLAKTAAAATGTTSKSQEQRLKRARKDYGIWAEELQVTKTCFPDGKSVLTYEIKGLCSKSSELERVYFEIESTAGLVSAPLVDVRAKELGIRWKTEPSKPAATVDDAIEQVRTMKGYFTGAFRFQKNEDGSKRDYNFGWTITIFNADAVTGWEYDNLYIKANQKHVDKSDLDSLTEYFACLAWLPVRKFVVKMSPIPGSNIPPAFRYFRLKTRDFIPKQEVSDAKTLWLRPNPASTWLKNNGGWEADYRAQKQQASSFVADAKGGELLSVDYPVPGSYYSIDWNVQQPPVGDAMEDYICEAEVIRGGLLRHRGNIKTNRNTKMSKAISLLLRDLHREISKKYRTKSSTERFETTLMTYDPDSKRLLVIDGFVNDRQIARGAWKAWLPFGLGVTGACFRKAEAITYKREWDRQDADEPEHYLALPETLLHECILALPIDHPSIKAGDIAVGDSIRARQLVGVISVGSTYRASLLRPLCRPKERDFHSLSELRDRCQATCDTISKLVMNGGSNRSRGQKSYDV